MNNENEDIDIIFKNLLLPISGSIMVLSPIMLMIWTIPKPLITNKQWRRSSTQIKQFVVL